MDLLKNSKQTTTLHTIRDILQYDTWANFNNNYISTDWIELWWICSAVINYPHIQNLQNWTNLSQKYNKIVVENFPKKSKSYASALLCRLNGRHLEISEQLPLSIPLSLQLYQLFEYTIGVLCCCKISRLTKIKRVLLRQQSGQKKIPCMHTLFS